ncbi:MAG: hypothetical protein PHZ09_13300, partial [Eubacteriales bacterium]|nr:hypothetical protein [Eubacteriales bacterium]
YEPAVIKLGAGEVREITLLCVLDRKTADEYAAVFPNGWFIDGYITLTSGNGNVSSIPYTGFCGSFSRLDAIDPSIYDPGSYYQSTGFYSEITENGRKSEIRLGYDGKQLSYDSKLIAFSPNDDGYADKLLFEFCLLRNVSHVSFTVSDVSDNSDKEAPLFTRHVSGGLKKSHAGSFSAGKYTAEIWNGRAADNYYYVYPDGEYRMTLSVAESGGTRQTYSLPFVVDTAAPRLASFEFGIGEDGGRNLTVELSDNHYISRVRLYTAGYDTEVYMSDAAPDMPISDYTCSFDITGIDAGFLYLEATDYASNTATYRININ